ncbi:MAG: LPXTG cell wall anchor domain-containing protein [Streptococcus parasanguinis]|nr:LPXTG cell wall anchor domain-containing protein [Streptococcus parasanguinis]
MNKKLVLATVATIATVGTATGVKADEVQGTTTAGDNTSTVTTAETGRTGAEKNETAQADKQPTTETNAHTLPNTGSESTLILSFAGMFILSRIARIALKREGE